MNIEKASANVITMDEEVKAAAVPDKQNEEYVKAEVVPEKNMNDTEYLDL